MTEWTTHQPAFDGDAPEGVGLDTHYIQRRLASGSPFYEDCDIGHGYHLAFEYRYLPRNPPATYAQVKAYCEQHGHPVPPKPINYEAWRPVLTAFYGNEKYEEHFDGADLRNIRELIAAMRVAINIPACMEDVKG